MVHKKHITRYLLMASCLMQIHALSPSTKQFALSPKEIEKIGRQIWRNEANEKEELLIFWSDKESFPSLGIGHNIWLPPESKLAYTQEFPRLCTYLKEHHIKLPAWLEDAQKTGAPWESREAFYSDHKRRNELRNILVKTIALQTQFMIDRLQQKIPQLLSSAPAKKRKKIRHILDLLLATPKGTYALVDYLNFKGDGLNPREETKGQRWGLLAVLLDMPENVTADNVVQAFTISAAKKMLMLIEHSEPDYKRLQFFKGWMKRLGTYIE